MICLATVSCRGPLRRLLEGAVLVEGTVLLPPDAGAADEGMHGPLPCPCPAMPCDERGLGAGSSRLACSSNFPCWAKSLVARHLASGR